RLSRSGEARATISSRGGIGPAGLDKVLRGELDWIVMKALEKDRTRRYETASSLARDIQHYLDDEPVEACPPTLGYRLRQYLRKHAAAILRVVLFVVTLKGVTLFSIWQASRAMVAELVARTAEEEATRERDRALAEKENTQAALGFLWEDVLSQASPFQTHG